MAVYGAKVPMVVFHWPRDLKEADWMGRRIGVDEGAATSRFGVLCEYTPNVMGFYLVIRPQLVACF